MIFNQPQYRFYKEYNIKLRCNSRLQLSLRRSFNCRSFNFSKNVMFEYKDFSGGTCAKLNHFSLSDFDFEPKNILLIDI